MSLKPTPDFVIPELTAQIARAAFPNGNPYMTMRDELDVFYTDEQFADLFSHTGQPGEAPWRLALVTVMQFGENLTDRQAADAVRARIDWKYALGLEMTDAGFHYSVLSEFRTRLLTSEAERRLLDALLARCKERKLLKARGKQRTDSTHILTAIRTLNRLELVGETLHHTLNILADVAPDWLQAQITPEWFTRYGLRFDNSRLPTTGDNQSQPAQPPLVPPPGGTHGGYAERDDTQPAVSVVAVADALFPIHKREPTPEECAVIRQLHADGESLSALCRRVYGHKDGKTFAWIKDAVADTHSGGTDGGPDDRIDLNTESGRREFRALLRNGGVDWQATREQYKDRRLLN